ncbi:hypothetical protein R3I93_004670 [Phoxinus phoxinus]|uniref:Uncharacterized protein n=1 Tax=Phoxinus phoxinus TaxID=58324 RepID=A0AAN9DGX5_9TELE
MGPLDGIRAGMSKKVNKELTQKRYHGYGKGKLPEDCLAIMGLALEDFLEVVRKLQGPKAIPGDELEKNDRLLVLYYLEAVVILKLLQRPGVVTIMTVEEWQGRTQTEDGCSVAVKEHKTAASQVAEVPLTADQELWFSLYFRHIRPVMLQGPRSGDDAAAEGRFFISTSGRPIHNPCNDLYRLHAKYNIPAVTSGEARMAFETASKNLSEVDRNAVARLLGHTPETAEKHYRMRTPNDAKRAVNVLEQIGGNTRSGSGVSTSRQDNVDAPGASTSRQDNVHAPGASTSQQDTFDMLPCPVSPEQPPPKRARRDLNACFVVLHRL